MHTAIENTFPEIAAKSRLAFLGVGWIGRNRMKAIGASGAGTISKILDVDARNAQEAQQLFPQAQLSDTYEDILQDPEIDGVVIATPSAMHAGQAIAALRSGKSVFCQKPLARDKKETQQVIAAAKEAGKLLSVDFSYRYTKAMQTIHALVQSGELGKIYAVQLTFHNAYGPDKSWFYDPSLSGGGCVMDLGIHLIDLALWTLDFPAVESVHSRLFHKGALVKSLDKLVEDYAVAGIDLAGGTNLNLNCSWNLPAGKEADIQVVFYGTNGGAAFKNVDGSFYDFKAERFWGTKTEVLFEGKDPWGGRAGVDWTCRLAAGEGYDQGNGQLIQVAQLIDQIYGRE